jgi:uncharacterized protein YggT (Ycf19 family)
MLHKEQRNKMVDNKLLQEEAQRANNYEAVKTEVKSELAAEIVSRANQIDSENSRINNLSSDMRHQAVNEVVETQSEVQRGRILARVSQIVDYIFYVIYSLLTIRLLLALFAARQSNEFVQFIYAISEPFYAPFKGIVPSPTVEGGYTLALPIVIALVVNLLIHLGINGLLRIFVHRKTEI